MLVNLMGADAPANVFEQNFKFVEDTDGQIHITESYNLNQEGVKKTWYMPSSDKNPVVQLFKLKYGSHEKPIGKKKFQGIMNNFANSDFVNSIPALNIQTIQSQYDSLGDIYTNSGMTQNQQPQTQQMAPTQVQQPQAGQVIQMPGNEFGEVTPQDHATTVLDSRG